LFVFENKLLLKSFNFILTPRVHPHCTRVPPKFTFSHKRLFYTHTHTHTHTVYRWPHQTIAAPHKCLYNYNFYHGK